MLVPRGTSRRRAGPADVRKPVQPPSSRPFPLARGGSGVWRAAGVPRRPSNSAHAPRSGRYQDLSGRRPISGRDGGRHRRRAWSSGMGWLALPGSPRQAPRSSASRLQSRRRRVPAQPPANHHSTRICWRPVDLADPSAEAIRSTGNRSWTPWPSLHISQVSPTDGRRPERRPDGVRGGKQRKTGREC